MHSERVRILISMFVQEKQFMYSKKQDQRTLVPVQIVLHMFSDYNERDILPSVVLLAVPDLNRFTFRMCSAGCLLRLYLQ